MHSHADRLLAANEQGTTNRARSSRDDCLTVEGIADQGPPPRSGSITSQLHRSPSNLNLCIEFPSCNLDACALGCRSARHPIRAKPRRQVEKLPIPSPSSHQGRSTESGPAFPSETMPPRGKLESQTRSSPGGGFEGPIVSTKLGLIPSRPRAETDPRTQVSRPSEHARAVPRRCRGLAGRRVLLLVFLH